MINTTFFGAESRLEHIGEVSLILLVLNGEKSSGAGFWNHLWSIMTHICFASCKLDSDIWMRPEKKENGLTYW